MRKQLDKIQIILKDREQTLTMLDNVNLHFLATLGVSDLISTAGTV